MLRGHVHRDNIIQMFDNRTLNAREIWKFSLWLTIYRSSDKFDTLRFSYGNFNNSLAHEHGNIKIYYFSPVTGYQFFTALLIND